MMILLTFVVAFLTVALLHFTPRRIRNFVYGTNVRTPFLNILIAFFGNCSNLLIGIGIFFDPLLFCFQAEVRRSSQEKIFQGFC